MDPSSDLVGDLRQISAILARKESPPDFHPTRVVCMPINPDDGSGHPLRLLGAPLHGFERIGVHIMRTFDEYGKNPGLAE
jgi:hypothetical protein